MVSKEIMPLSIHKTIYPWATAQQLNDILLLLLFKPFFFTNCLAPRQVGERKIIFVKKTTLLDCENKKHDHGASTSSRVIFISTSQHQQTHQQQMQQQQQDLKCMSASNKKRKRN
jgi:NAD(P)-dependent dehydrogenase (short-subunit alcohol dehydrogenase family)